MVSLDVRAAGWRERYADRICTADEAVRVVRSGDHVTVGSAWCTPPNLCAALLRRKDELTDVQVHHVLGLVPWSGPGTERAFRVHSGFLTPNDRPLLGEGRLEYAVGGPFRYFRGEEPVRRADVCLIRVSAPDENGFCSFGSSMWGSKSMLQGAGVVIAELDPAGIRTQGDNFVHVSAFDRIVEHAGPEPAPRQVQRTEEETRVAEVINTIVAEELIEDGDTIQIGTGTVSAGLAHFLQNKHDLGVHTEVIFGGIPTLVRQGVVTGRRKGGPHPEKVVGTAFAGCTPEEMAYANGNPAFELYDVSYTNDIRTLMAHDRFVAYNNALLLDVTGQMTAEAIGPRIHSGTGGQLAFAIGAAYSRGGRYICVTPSSSIVNGERRSRIMPVLPEGTAVSVPRGYMDIVVTEQGIARLRGATLRQRVEQLIAIAHPDFREELRTQARTLHGVG
jgi:4-hydroxybutyrate CoA-transferase